jgi:hypothetical protein
VVTIADHIGLEKGSNNAKKIAHYLAHAPPSLLVLDNLETPWEPHSSWSEVEEFLSQMDPPLPCPSAATKYPVWLLSRPSLRLLMVAMMMPASKNFLN